MLLWLKCEILVCSYDYTINSIHWFNSLRTFSIKCVHAHFFFLGWSAPWSHWRAVLFWICTGWHSNLGVCGIPWGKWLPASQPQGTVVKLACKLFWWKKTLHLQLCLIYLNSRFPFQWNHRYCHFTLISAASLPVAFYFTLASQVGLWTHLDFNIEYNGNSVIFANVSVKDVKPVILEDGAGAAVGGVGVGGHSLTVTHTYSVRWFESNLPHSRRAERLRDYSFFPKTLEIHWLSIINSLVLVVLLLGFVIIILMRVLKNDFARLVNSGKAELVFTLDITV